MQRDSPTEEGSNAEPGREAPSRVEPGAEDRSRARARQAASSSEDAPPDSVDAGRRRFLSSADSERVGVELLAPSVSSITASDVLSYPQRWGEDGLAELARDENPHLAFVDWYENGYAVVEFTREEARYTAWSVDASENSADATRRKLGEYVVPDGQIRLDRSE